jgi:CheY-like chemotaxis protein
VAPGNYIQLSVCDTGVGIAADMVHTIFEPYFTTKKPGEGTGMGLSVVHGIVKSYQGEIDVTSTPGRGTCFSIFLPATGKRASSETYQAGVQTGGSERILFVDDELPIVRMGSQTLSRLGYQVSECTGSLEALNMFRSGTDHFDLVITDMTMPNMSGDELAKALLAIRPDIPIILLTGYSKRVDERTMAAIGIKAFAFKPIIRKELAAMVRDVLDGASLTLAGSPS